MELKQFFLAFIYTSYKLSSLQESGSCQLINTEIRT